MKSPRIYIPFSEWNDINLVKDINENDEMSYPLSSHEISSPALAAWRSLNLKYRNSNSVLFSPLHCAGGCFTPREDADAWESYIYSTDSYVCRSVEEFEAEFSTWAGALTGAPNLTRRYYSKVIENANIERYLSIGMFIYSVLFTCRQSNIPVLKYKVLNFNLDAFGRITEIICECCEPSRSTKSNPSSSNPQKDDIVHFTRSENEVDAPVFSVLTPWQSSFCNEYVLLRNEPISYSHKSNRIPLVPSMSIDSVIFHTDGEYFVEFDNSMKSIDVSISQDNAIYVEGIPDLIYGEYTSSSYPNAFRFSDNEKEYDQWNIDPRYSTSLDISSFLINHKEHNLVFIRGLSHVETQDIEPGVVIAGVAIVFTSIMDDYDCNVKIFGVYNDGPENTGKSLVIAGGYGAFVNTKNGFSGKANSHYYIYGVWLPYYEHPERELLIFYIVVVDRPVSQGDQILAEYFI